MDRTTLAYLLIVLMVLAAAAIIARWRYTSHAQSYRRSQKREAARELRD